MMEIWKIISEFPKYEVSDLGMVRTLKTGRIRKPTMNTRGYLHVGFRKKGHLIFRTLHRIVATAYCDVNGSNAVIDHINGIKTDNRSINLRWCSQSDNIHKSRKRSFEGRRRKIDDNEKDTIVNLFKQGYSRRNIALLTGLSRMSVMRVVNLI